MFLLPILSYKRKKMKNSTTHGFLFVLDSNVNYLTLLDLFPKFSLVTTFIPAIDIVTLNLFRIVNYFT